MKKILKTILPILMLTIMSFNSFAAEWIPLANGGWMIKLANEYDDDTLYRTAEIVKAPGENEDEKDPLVSYYEDIDVSNEAREYLARMTHAEYENGTDIDKELTVEVTLNRVKHGGFKNSVIDVLFESGQYSTRGRIKNPKTPPTQADYDAVDYVLTHGLTRIPMVLAAQGLDFDATKCVYFDTGKKNGRDNFKYNGHWFGFDYKG